MIWLIIIIIDYSIILITFLRHIFFPILYSLTKLFIYLLPIHLLSIHKMYNLILLLIIILKSRLFSLVIKIIQQLIKVFTYIFLLILDLLKFSLSLSTRILCPLFIIQYIYQLPTTFLINLIFIITKTT